MYRSSIRRKNIILGILIVMLVGMTIAYSALSSYLTINGTSSITSDFKVIFTDIQEGTMNGANTVKKEITAPTTATFQVNLEKPGSSAEYNVTVQNQGKLDAYLESIEGIDEANEKAPTDITFKISGITRYTKLQVNESKTFKVIVTFDSSATSLPSESKQLTLKLNFAQDSGNAPEPEPEQQTVTEITNTLLSSGTTYNYLDGTYLKGKPTTNYVWFNGFMWRIMGVNADGSIRMITEENVTTIPRGAKDTAEQYDSSYANDWLNNYFYPKLKNKEYLVKQTWCSETTTDSSSARTTCTSNLSTTPQYVGLLSLDEYKLSSGSSSYLVNSQYFWTLTPYSASDAWYVYVDGSADFYSVSYADGVRPVINISSEITITGGNGTLTDPYMFEDKSSSVTRTLKDNSQIGEYVTYAGRNYRVVETSESGTKLILDGYYDSNNDGTLEESDYMVYGTNCTLCTTINEDNFINWLSNSNETEKVKLASTTWYRGDYWGSSSTTYNYKTNLESTSNPYEGSVGLIRVGEMLSGQSETILSKNHTVANDYNNAQYYWTATSGQSETILSKNHTVANDYNNAQYYWTATSYSASYAWSVSIGGTADRSSVPFASGVRPVINISSEITITGGNGTPNSPYQI